MSDLTLLCIHPHPDDESIACGGVLSRYADEGHRVVVVTCTGGEEGENLAGIDLGEDDLPAHRRRELAAALAALGVDEHVWLGYRDSGMAGAASNHHPDAFAAADPETAATRLARLIREVRPDVVVSDDADGTYGHPDHVQAHRVTERAVAVAADPGWDTEELEPWTVAKRYVVTLSRTAAFEAHRELLEAGLASPWGEEELAGPEALPFGTPDERITTTVDVTAQLDRKLAAMAAHRSQIGDGSFFLNLPDGLARRVFGVERFVLTAGQPGRDEDDLFDGLR